MKRIVDEGLSSNLVSAPSIGHCDYKLTKNENDRPSVVYKRHKVGDGAVWCFSSVARC